MSASDDNARRIFVGFRRIVAVSMPAVQPPDFSDAKKNKKKKMSWMRRVLRIAGQVVLVVAVTLTLDYVLLAIVFAVRALS